jgi:hypothetical protein
VLSELTGPPDGPGIPPPEGFVERLAGAAQALVQLGGPPVDPIALLTERGLTRRGRTTCGGHGRLLPTADGWVAVNLPRAGDLDLVPAWLGRTLDGEDPWMAIAEWLLDEDAAPAAARAQELGLAVAEAGDGVDEQTEARGTSDHRTPYLVHRWRARPPVARPRIVDLSSLWAGPLATRLLRAAGAEVTTVQGRGRGPADHVVDFDDGEKLADLLLQADVVVEASRPRVLDGLGLGPDWWLSERDGVWLSITGYGRTGPWRQRVAFGDDAGAASGASQRLPGGPWFLADAAADPVAGLHAALAVQGALVGGWSGHIDLSLRESLAYAVAP